MGFVLYRTDSMVYCIKGYGILDLVFYRVD